MFFITGGRVPVLRQIGDRLSPVVKYWIFLVGIVGAIFAVIFGSFAASYLHLEPADRAVVAAIFPKLISFPFLGAMALVAIVGSLVSWLFRAYIIPILRMAEQTRLITVANPDYRIDAPGAREVNRLAEIINESADAFQALQREVETRSEAASRALRQERNRFAALLAELPHGVLVCNTEGQILLYNRKAQLCLEEAASTAENRLQAACATLGLGRSVFALLDREPIAHALEKMSHKLRHGEAKPVLGLMTKLCGDRFIRVNMAPVRSADEGVRALDGFVLTLEDITGEVAADSERDYQLQRTVDAIQHSLGEIHKQIELVCSLPGIGTAACHMHRQGVERVTVELEKHLALARKLYSRHRQAFGNRENVRSDTLLLILQKELQQRFPLTVEVEVSSSLWLDIDSYALVQTVATLAGMLVAEHAIPRLRLRVAATSEELARLTIAWPETPVPAATCAAWEAAPLFMDADGRTETPYSIAAAHGGALRVSAVAEQGCLGVELDLPAALTEAGDGRRPTLPSRPVYYAFDLFHQPGQQALGHLPLRQLTYVVFDTETTGLDPAAGDEIIQLGAVRIVNGRLRDEEVIDQLVNPRRPVPVSSVAVHGIEPALLVNQPPITEVLPQFHDFARDAVLVAHNAAFDMKMLQMKEAATGLRFDQPVLDTLLLSTIVHPNLEGHSLDAIAERLNVRIVGRHTALGDALATAAILLKLIPLLEAQGVTTLNDALAASAQSPYATLTF
jgi:DNA polymerase-3 subunit epsilon